MRIALSSTAVAILTATLALPAAVGAQTSTANSAMPGGKEALQQSLRTAKSRDDLRDMIEKAGFVISSINEDEGNEVEYEVVKGDQSYEVQAEFANRGGPVKEVDVTTNLWRADTTKQMMVDGQYRPTTPLVATPESRRFSDRNYKSTWSDEKQQIEQAMQPGMTIEDFQAKLVQMGYKVSSVNDRESDVVEFEIVRNDQSYEVEFARDPATKVGKSVDVSTNMWETERTEQLKQK